MSGATERWQRLKTLFEGALAVGADERPSWLEQACPDDAGLRDEVSSLVASHHGAGAFLAQPALEGGLRVHGELEPEAAEDLSGQRIGPYQVLSLVGRGGMGAVYRARRADTTFEKTVALKLIRRGMDSDFVLARFQAERQILAGLEHPNIARLLDGGSTADGRPYLVMEYVEGERIDAFAEAHRLDVGARLRLFLQVCEAVAYAHANLIIHRDLKPANVLVTAEGVPKLLDFGIAKVLASAEAGEPTATMVAVMTPEYASPEQVRGRPVTTASDVYSLGVVLYELLTGRRPYTLANRQQAEIERVVCETEPERPSTAVGRPGLGGDLDSIVMMALRKEPARRYSSVERLADDIRRFLSGRAVQARPDTWAYRAGKFLRRNRVAVLSGALVVASLVAGLGATLWQARVAARERERAERRFADVRALANSFLFEFHDEVARLPGSTPARRLVVRKALSYLDSLAGEAGDDLSLQRELAAAYLKVGDVQGRPGSANLGDLAGARQSYQRALAIRERLAAARADDAEAQLDLAETLSRLGQVLARSGDAAAARAHQERAVAIAERQAEAPSPRAARVLWSTAAELGNVLAQAGDTDAARARVEKALRTGEARGAGWTDPEVTLALADAYAGLGNILRMASQIEASLQSHQRAADLVATLVRADPSHAAHGRRLSAAERSIGDSLHAGGRLADARERYRTALAMLEALAAQDPADAQVRREVAVTYLRIGQLERNLERDGTAALASYRRALAILEPLAAADPANRDLRRDMRIGHGGVGLLLLNRGQLAGGLQAFRDEVAMAEPLAAADPDNPQYQRELLGSYANLGKAQEMNGDLAGALETLGKAVALGDGLLQAGRANPQLKDEIAFAQGRLGDALLAARQPAAALAAYARAVETATEVAQGSGPASLLTEQVAWWQGRTSNGHVAMAGAAAAAERAHHWREGARWARLALATLQGVSAQRTLSSYTAPEVARLTAQAAACDRRASASSRP